MAQVHLAMQAALSQIQQIQTQPNTLMNSAEYTPAEVPQGERSSGEPGDAWPHGPSWDQGEDGLVGMRKKEIGAKAVETETIGVMEKTVMEEVKDRQAACLE